jgi:hypothetical protein
MAGQDLRSRRAPPGRVLLLAARRPADFAAASAPGSFDGKQKTRRDETAAPDSFDRSDSSSPADRSDSDAPSLSHQAATLGLQRPGSKNLYQRGILHSARTAQTIQEVAGDPRAQLQSQSRSEKYLQGSGHQSRCRNRTLPGILRRFNYPWDEASDGASHSRAQDRSDHFTGLEERSVFRR